MANFNPRSREGSDQSVFLQKPIVVISIHAPVKGATKKILELRKSLPYFNPRSREGSDLIRSSREAIYSNFNPRSREGSDVVLHPLKIEILYFNPRSREGSDLQRQRV